MKIPRLLSSCLMIALLAGAAFSQVEKKKTPSLTDQQEATAIAFAKRHHRELFQLLNQLKEMDVDRYESAISELLKTSERIDRFKERTPDRYKTEIELWKIDSRVRLLIARSVNGMEEETREQVKLLLMKRNRIRASQLKKDRERLNERVAKVTEQISELTKESETLAQRDLDRLMRSARARSTSRNRAATAKQSTSTRNNSAPSGRQKTPPTSAPAKKE